MARTKIADKSIADDLSGVSIGFVHGETLTVALDSLSEEIVRRLALHGLSQKLGDAYSGEDDPAAALACSKAVAERLAEGDWAKAREGGSGGRISDLSQALANVTGQPVEVCLEKLADMDKDQKSGLRKHPKIAAELARIAAERAAKKAEDAVGSEGPDLAALLG